jgi:molecular chaperone GrpE
MTMSNKWAKRDEEAAPTEEPGAADEAGEPVAETIDLGEGAGIESPAALETENSDLKDQLLRALAETENVRRRSQREKEDAGRYAITNFARDMLVVADNLHRALEAIPGEDLSEDHELYGLYQGVQLVERDLQQAFERHGIVRIDALGQKFDPHLHQAMFEIEDPDAEPGTVLQSMAPGYMINGRLLRPAMVGVAKGSRKASADERGAAASDSATTAKAPVEPPRKEGTPPRR